MLSAQLTVGLAEGALGGLGLLDVLPLVVLVLAEVHRLGVLEELRDELVHPPVVHDPVLVAEVLEHLLELRVELESLDAVPHHAHVVVVQHADDEGQDEEDPDDEDGHQEEDVEAVGLEDQGEEVEGVVEGDQGVGRVDAVVPALELEAAELEVGGRLAVVW